MSRNQSGNPILRTGLSVAAAVGGVSCTASSPSAIPVAFPPTLTVASGQPLPAGRGSHAVGIVGGNIVVAGGSSWSADKQTKTYNSDSFVWQDGQWVAGPAFPHAVVEGAYASDDRGLVVAGGRTAAGQESADATRLSGTQGNWLVEALPSMPRAVAGCAGTIHDGTLYIFGGMIDDAMTTQVIALDLRSPQAEWQKRADIPAAARAYPAVLAFGPYIYLFGGYIGPGADGESVALNDVLRYDPAADAWATVGQLPAAGYAWNAVAVDPEHILIAGRADAQIHDDIWVLDVPTMKVVQTARLPRAVTCAALVQSAPDTWWLIGGEPDANRNRVPDVTAITIGYVRQQRNP